MRFSRAYVAVLALVPTIGVLGCVQAEPKTNVTTNVTVGPSPLPNPNPNPAVSRPGPSVSVSYLLGRGDMVCPVTPCTGVIATSPDGRSWSTSLTTGQTYKVFMVVRHGQVPGRTLDLSLTPGFNPDPGTALRNIPETGNPESLVLGYGSFAARSGSLPITAEVIEHTAGPEDMPQDFVYRNNVVLQSR